MVLFNEFDVRVTGRLRMANVASGSVARQLGLLFDGGSSVALPDRQLLERFTARGGPSGEAAFAAMVARHGPMVLGVCRQLLGDHHHAEDAFQAVFLVLARQAGSIRDPDRLGTWLYWVALRTARTARARIARRRRTEEEGAVRQSIAGPSLSADQAIIEREQALSACTAEIELGFAPAFPGACVCSATSVPSRSTEAARRLRCPAGTLRSRLARAPRSLSQPGPTGHCPVRGCRGRHPHAQVRLGARSSPPDRINHTGRDPDRGGLATHRHLGDNPLPAKRRIIPIPCS